MTNLDHVIELRAELASCLLTRRERAQIKRELKAAMTSYADVERGHAAALESLLDEAASA